MSAAGRRPEAASGRRPTGWPTRQPRLFARLVEMTRLDLGCGKNKAPGFIGADRLPLPGVDVVCDLGRFPYPFASDSADCVRVSHLLEHLDDPMAALTEIWRISKHRALVQIRVPHYSGHYAWKDPTHRRCFSAESFSYFGENPYSYYTEARFQVVQLRLNYFMEPPARRIYRFFGRFVQAMLNRHPTFGERFLSYLVGGIDEISVTLEAVKR